MGGSAGATAGAPRATVYAAAAHVGQHRVTLTDLGVAGQANAINERGQVTGRLQIGGPSVLPVHAFLRTGGHVQDLGTISGDFSEGLAVNDRGHVVGESSVDGSVSNHAVLWRDGQVIDLGAGRALGINNRDQVVGIAAVDGRTRAFRWENGRRTLLETPDGAVSSAVAINDRGDVVGEISAPVSAPVRWRNGHLQHLPVPAPGVAAAATDVNELGQVLITTSEDVANKGYLLTGSRLRPLGVPAGEVGILPAALNDRGDVAALGSSGSGPLLWRDGRFTALPTAGFGFAQAHDLNNRDVVVGGGNSTATNTFQALLWS